MSREPGRFPQSRIARAGLAKRPGWQLPPSDRGHAGGRLSARPDSVGPPSRALSYATAEVPSLVQRAWAVVQKFGHVQTDAVRVQRASGPFKCHDDLCFCPNSPRDVRIRLREFSKISVWEECWPVALDSVPGNARRRWRSNRSLAPFCPAPPPMAADPVHAIGLYEIRQEARIFLPDDLPVRQRTRIQSRTRRRIGLFPAAGGARIPDRHRSA